MRSPPNLWFGGNALEAAEHDVSIFPRSRIVHVSHHDEGDPGEAGTVMVVDSELDGQPDAAINGGADAPFTATISLLVDCDGLGRSTTAGPRSVLAASTGTAGG